MAPPTNGRNPITGRYQIPKRILVVDDDALICSLLKDVLEEEGYGIVAVDSGEKAIDLLGKGRFDLVISDMVMPGVNGIKVLLECKRTQPNCPVIMITGYPSMETVVRLIHLGAADYIIKPFNVDIVTITVAKVFELAKRNKHAGISSEGLSPTDHIAGTFSSDVFAKLLDIEVERSTRRRHVCSLLLAEIDHFAALVEKGGNDVADELLKTLAVIMKKLMGPGDIIGRTSESGLALIMPETNRNEANSIGHGIRQNSEWNFTVSVGAACFPRDASDGNGLMETAGEAVKAAKARGGNTVLLPR